MYARAFGETLLVYLGESAILAALVPLKIAVITAHGPRTVRRVLLAVVAAGAWSFATARPSGSKNLLPDAYVLVEACAA